MRLLSVALLVLSIVTLVFSDMYMHNPRGSNNRLNGAGGNVENQNRLFDSQNNAAGGYCWGPPLHFYVGSQLNIEWTSQHSCGMENNKCHVILQYMCGEFVRDGNTSNTIPVNAQQYNAQVAPGVYTFGMHEDYQFYTACQTRQRNGGLFIADRNLNNQAGATATRQNNNGNRRGFECPEERDYYPYWHPSPWIDIAVITNEPSRCNYYQAESQNVKPKNYCNTTQFNNGIACPQGQWLTAPAHKDVPGQGCISAPDCVNAPWNRDNHLGNGIGGQMTSYNWTIPSCIVSENCVLRVRYNISTTDYDGWSTFSSRNGPNLSPVKQNPYVDPFGCSETGGYCNLSLAINTAQFGRTFQDRSHVFAIRQRPAGVSSTARIFNINVRGKRGNIVEVYPSVEYDFAPNSLLVRPSDYLHIQWTGCDTNPQGRAGEGRDQTDRSNFLQVLKPGANYFDKWDDIPASSRIFQNRDDAMRAAYLDQTNCLNFTQLVNNGNQDTQNPRNCMKLNAASPYIDLGLVQVSFTGTVYYRCSRNNNFSNRSQKGVIVSNPALLTFGVVIVAVGSAAFFAATVFAGLAAWAAKSATAPFANSAVFNAGAAN